jgi:hypothetical protein
MEVWLMYKWIIVGGGIQGMTMATFLLKRHKVDINQLAIIDPYEEPLSRWKHNTNIISMPYLRSPSVHHIDIEPFSLQSYVKTNTYDWNTAFYGQYKRPSLQAFNEHCDHLMNDLFIKQAWIQGRVDHTEQTPDGWRVQLRDGRLVIGQNLLLAIGISEQPIWPKWAEDLNWENESYIYHVFDPNLPSFDYFKRPITIIGGGITAAHLALKLSSIFPNEVTILKRHPFRIHDFDSNPAWLGPKNQLSFRKEKSYSSRRDKIRNARNKGSIPQDLYVKLLSCIRKGKLHIVDGEVENGTVSNNQVLLFDQGNQFIHKAGTILLATGFQPGLPGKEWLEPMIQKYKLPCAECGYPIVSNSLRWGPNLYVTGALAELEMGPIARNISGARQAADRIVSSLS